MKKIVTVLAFAMTGDVSTGVVEVEDNLYMLSKQDWRE